MPRRWPITVAALALLFAGLTNAHAHVHLCFDGQEPPTSVHGAHDDHGHHELDADTDHDDLDIDLQEQVLTKSFKPDLPTVVSPALYVLPPAQRADDAALTGSATAPRPAPRFSLPRLRAPPR